MSAPSRARALESAIALGCERVLTSGAQADALAGADNIAARVAQAEDRIAVMAGAGIDAGNVGQIVRRTGVAAVHASARALRSATARAHWLPGLSGETAQTDTSRVRALREALDALA